MARTAANQWYVALRENATQNASATTSGCRAGRTGAGPVIRSRDIGGLPARVRLFAKASLPQQFPARGVSVASRRSTTCTQGPLSRGLISAAQFADVLRDAGDAATPSQSRRIGAGMHSSRHLRDALKTSRLRLLIWDRRSAAAFGRQLWRGHFTVLMRERGGREPAITRRQRQRAAGTPQRPIAEMTRWSE